MSLFHSQDSDERRRARERTRRQKERARREKEYQKQHKKVEQDRKDDQKYINKGCIKDYLISIPLTDLKILDLQNKEVLPDKVEVLVNNLKETISLT